MHSIHPYCECRDAGRSIDVLDSSFSSSARSDGDWRAKGKIDVPVHLAKYLVMVYRLEGQKSKLVVVKLA
jgi:hypothetical protein